MTLQHMVLTATLATAPSAAVAQETLQMTQPAAGSAEFAQCLQAQAVIRPALESARAQLEMARQTNSPAAMRVAVDGLDAVLRDVRAQLEPCGQMTAPTAGPMAMAGHVMPGGSPATTTTAADQNMANMPGHNMPAPAAQSSATPATRAAAPGAPKQGAPAGHNMANMPAPAVQKPAAPSRGAGPAASKQAAPAGHNMANMTSPPSAAASKPGPSAATQPDMVEDPVSKTQVDARTALRAQYHGRSYYFQSDKDRQEFMKNPAKYVSAK